MEKKLISLKTAKLAKEKGFNILCEYFYSPEGISYKSDLYLNEVRNNAYSAKNLEFCKAPTKSLLRQWIRETRGVHIEIHRNASGWFWSMCKSESGTDLGYSKFSGPNDSGVWDEHDDALENALQVQLSYDLPNSLNVIKHWGNYAELAIETFGNMAI